MFSKILIANRGEIACRVMRTAKRLGARTVAVYSDADRDALHVAMADEAWRLGPAPASESYLRIDAIIAAAKASGAEAVHPGYGFLSENPDFVEACEAEGLVFIGPPASAIRAMGLKDAAKRLMEQAGVPVVPGYHGDSQDAAFLAKQADAIGYPVLIKARAGGGGKGMRRVDAKKDFKAALEGAQREATSSFGDSAVLIEKFVATPRHIEIQIFADGHGNAVHLFERDCSLQRRHQKVIEEAPAPGMPEEMRAAMGEAAVRAAQAVGYRGAGTVEFITDASEGLRADRFWFMEMNTRLQVEHPVTEAITGTDLVEWQIHIAAGEKLPKRQDELAIDGWAFEARVYAEDAARNFMPATGRLTHLSLPEDRARIDSGVREGDVITPFYDPMIAKLIVHGPTRAAALAQLASALDDCRAAGCVTNLGFLGALARHEGFAKGEVDTGLIDRDLATLAAEDAPPPEAAATAALAALGLLSPRASDDPWDALAGWRLWSQARQFVTLAVGDTALEAVALAKGDGAVETRIGENVFTIRATPLGADRARLDFGDRILEVAIARMADSITVFHAGRAHRFEQPNALSEAMSAETGGDKVTAPLPGVVRLVRVKPGDLVTSGDAVAMIEAMKMEHTLTAPRDGKVAEVLVAEGDQVEDGALLLSLEAEG